MQDESRLYRIFRLPQATTARALRLKIDSCHGNYPTLREIEFAPETNADFQFPPWIVAVNVTHDPALPGHGQEFIPLAQGVWPGLQAQQVWLSSFSPEFLAGEPRVLSAFLSGSFHDWCQVDRSQWRGIERVLAIGRWPLWASCGGAQGLAILAENGTGQSWDCPHCRKPDHPKVPIYTHIGHREGAPRPCGDYAACIFERGPHTVTSVKTDPVFAGLSASFLVMESHCGQIEWAPAGWELIVTAGPGTLTRTQCLKVKDRPIYAAQFHIEMDGTPHTSAVIMSNFLHLAQNWQTR